MLEVWHDCSAAGRPGTKRHDQGRIASQASINREDISHADDISMFHSTCGLSKILESIIEQLSVVAPVAHSPDIGLPFVDVTWMHKNTVTARNRHSVSSLIFISSHRAAIDVV
jgi:hypothetical protein